MLQRFLSAIPLTIIFLAMSDQWNIGGLGVGLVLGLVIMALIEDVPEVKNFTRVPVQFVWLIVYVVKLAWEIFLSSIDVARRVLHPSLPINPGELDVAVGAPESDILLAALSAHAVTVTPGELVVDFEVIDGQQHMIVHTLDLDMSREKIEREQENRARLLRRVLGQGEPTS